MAIYNEILAGRFARGIQKIFSMKGGVPTKQLSGEVMPIIKLEDSTSLENRVTHSWRSFAYRGSQALGGAGTFAAVRLRNPSASNVVAVLEKITLLNLTGADTPILTRGPTAGADLTTIDSGLASIRDVRMGPVNPAMIPSRGTPASQTGVVWFQGAVTATSAEDVIVDEHQEFVIGPGDMVTAFANVVNTSFIATFFWRERALEESELTG